MNRVVSAVIIGLAAPAWAGFDEGVAAYERGDYETALREFRPLAEQGDADAQFNLGIMYDNGRGVPQDYVQAVRWYRKAAEQGGAKAQDGRGVPQDYVQAHMWFNLAAAGSPPGESHDTATTNRDIVAKRMTPAQIAEAQRLARGWRPRRQ